MNTEDLRRLADRAGHVEGRGEDRLTDVHARIHRVRRRRTALGATSVVVAVMLVVAAVTLSASTDRAEKPIGPNTPTPTRTVEAPTGQVTILPEIGVGDIRGWELLAGRTNTQPNQVGRTDLTLTVETGGLTGFQSEVVTFCKGDPGTWWVLTMDLGGMDGGRNPDGSMQDGTRGMFGACSPDDPDAVPGATGNIEPSGRNYREAPMAYPMRMFVTPELPAAAQRCLDRTADVGACLSAHGLAPLDETDARFGFGVYEHKAAPIVLRGPDIESQALTMADGVEYLVDQAVVSAPGSSRLVVELPASERSRIVAVTTSETAALEDCAERLGHRKPRSPEEEQAQLEEFQRRCSTEVELRVDGRRPPSTEYEFHFGEQQVVLPPGDARSITVEVVKNDPRNVRYAVVVWEARS